MRGLKIQCPVCRRKDFETTEKFDPEIAPHGGMVRCLLPYHIDWLTASTTLASEMTCPECLGQLAPSGILHVIVPPDRINKFFKTPLESFSAAPERPVTTPNIGKPVFICEICGKECSTALALSGHKRSHKEGKNG